MTLHMKKIILCLISVLALTVSTEAQEYITTTKLKAQWRKQPVKVKDGGQTPDVITLLKAFNEQYPTWVISEILKREPAIKDGDQWESTDDYRVLVDRKNGYADLASETNIDQAEACVWLKDNGHRIFALRTAQENDPTPSLLCWYDYNPKTQTMTPAKSPADTFRPYLPSGQLGYILPMQGTDFEINEYYMGLPTLRHVYKWNQKEMTYDGAYLADFEYQSIVGDPETKTISESGIDWTHYALIKTVDRNRPILCLATFKSDRIKELMMFSEFDGELVRMDSFSGQPDFLMMDVRWKKVTILEGVEEEP